ncbi:Hypothetical protein AA314_03020 [Archangium gephyra]|uniref:Uncharacterized protein n=1 Tax=Archangium gephyra TaxID=48 RepID=A0AAC8Q5L6_9BACT|nr:Hypothetical protein AA314_03020 [Archangium gephyra]
MCLNPRFSADRRRHLHERGGGWSRTTRLVGPLRPGARKFVSSPGTGWPRHS